MNKFIEVSKEIFERDAKMSTDYEIFLPKRGTQNSAGHDFFIPYDVTIPAHSLTKVFTGISCSLDEDKVLLIVPRSSLGIKKHIRLANTVGVIDADYFGNVSNGGHIIAALFNDGDDDVVLKKGEAFIQGIIMPYLIAEGCENETVREGGIGSTTESK